MPSQHVDAFNHDPWAHTYDEDVRNQADPIRAGYAELLAWTVQQAQITPEDVVVDLGVGTGNTSAHILRVGELIGVDISEEMMKRAHPKLAHLPNVRFVQADLLEFFAQPRSFNRLISTYAIHHLTEPEKEQLFACIWRDLTPGGRAVFGDLMFADEAARATIEERYRAAGNLGIIEEFNEEFFWYVNSAEQHLQELGFEVQEIKRFSELSWGICAIKPVAQ